MPTIEIHGQCAAGFEPVKEAFAELFESSGEAGSSCAVYVKGELTVNLWAGRANQEGNAWQQDTLVNVFSVSKAVTALCVHKAVELGGLDLERPVADYWPEYGCQGKQRTLVKWLLNHKAGQPAMKTPLPGEALYDWERMTSTLASEEPWWEPGTQHGYHMISYGWLVGEVFRRAVGISVGEFLREELAGPLGLDMCFGVAEQDFSRIAELQAASQLPAPGRVSLFNHVMTHPGSLTAAALTNPLTIMNGANTEAWRRAEIPSANLHATAAALATLFGKVAGREGVLTDASIAHCYREESKGEDPVLLTTTRFGPGFMLQQPGSIEAEFGPGPNAFGHPGAGGALAFADPDRELGFGYAMNQMGPYVLIDPRPRALVDALYQCLAD
ncbi:MULTISPECIES: serine hydrolase domain-containing protein [unclassified Ketobacter]|jgi:CubicO group peptidase (beta-lactamase class C family)|uniref:serine hydrolase domain-containing protein n=1 Tax=unclassified Ketobacter TaxID=2639109 RepID=UPI000F0FF4B1|nr:MULTISPECIES: serine hydrolase domain-containing protein [unclassified Ketobacter]MCK5790137.1 beta-lactamase family protein [Ketobacter sp.]MEC8811354.1 serine hydrolase domain-containing protein [Pseudomonadota bacterium]RLT91517.1 MAG: class A beta-lactamase-related serine hydrolase [Ketobacter sp. GenoA1]RLT96203.1 MAG: class A beta-lactamase-related serine hydrolase [Ketobacter sp.]